MGAHVRRTAGIIMNPDSSTKTMCAPSRVAFFYLRPSFPLPLFDLFLVALQSAALRLLATEPELVQQAGNMTTMELHSTVLLDEDGDAPGRPQLGAEVVGDGPFEQQLHHVFTLRGRQGRWPTGGEANLQRLFPTTLQGIAPTHHRTRGAADHASYLVEGITLLEQTQRLTAPCFDQFSRTLGSRHRRAPVGGSRSLLHYLRDSQ